VLLKLSVSFQDTIEKKKVALEIVELTDYKKKIDGLGENVTLQYDNNEVELHISFELYTKIKEGKCKFIEMTLYKGNLGLYYIKNSKAEEKRCIEQ
jgi:hypothetical protein